ncbi:MAG: hypothetical protein JNM18_23095 [Planctomycetaceae bacterium]|nr:hypothetical protein [Planctomycetaceae bacterium]
MTTTATPAARSSRTVLFVILQLALIGAAAGWSSVRYSQFGQPGQLPSLRDKPLEIRPLYDQPVVVTDEQLQRVLVKLRPKNLQEKSRINHIDHALRFWGLPAKFDDPTVFNGSELREVLTDTGRFKKQFGEQAKPLLLETRRGVRVRVAEGVMSSSHVDHTLAGLAEVGTPLDFPVKTATRATNYRAMLEQSLRDFSLNQVEYEWSAMAYALFLPPAKGWRTSEGQEVTFDLLADRIMRQELPQGVCFGNHRLYTLVVLLRIDEEASPILSPEKREQIITFLADMTQRLVRSQNAEGFWDGDWPTRGSGGGEKPEKTSGDTNSDRILATGHALEWWAMVPKSAAERLHPPRDVLVRGGQWLVKTIDALTPEQTENYFTFLSHAGRALSLWRNHFPYEVSLNK